MDLGLVQGINDALDILGRTNTVAPAIEEPVEPEAAGGEECSTPRPVLIVTNISKKTNVGNILRSAAAFGVHEIVVVGMKKIHLAGVPVPSAMLDRRVCIAQAVKAPTTS